MEHSKAKVAKNNFLDENPAKCIFIRLRTLSVPMINDVRCCWKLSDNVAYMQIANFD